MFGRKKLIENYEREIKRLTEQNQKLIDRLLAMTNRDAYWDIKSIEEPVEAPKFVDPLGKIESMEAKTPEEIKEKEESLKYFTKVWGG